MDKIFKEVTRPIYTVDYFDLQDFVSKLYNTSFEFYDMDNGTVQVVSVDLSYFDADSENNIRLDIESGNVSIFAATDVINLLHKDGHIVDADYQIYIFW